MYLSTIKLVQNYQKYFGVQKRPPFYKLSNSADKPFEVSQVATVENKSTQTYNDNGG